MEVTALCITLVMKVLMLLLAPVHINDAQDRPFAVIVPTALQVFEYSSFSIHCEGLNTTTGWTVLRKREGEVGACITNWVTAAAAACAIKPAYLTDSGEYWCETGGERSNAVNIVVTAGPVILESPALPVTEGDSVTLSCRSKMSASTLITDFFKDGLYVGSSSRGKVTINRVTKLDEGLYKCTISDSGESPQSLLAVRGLRRATPHSSQNSCHVYVVLRTVFTVVLVAVLLLLVGFLHRGELRFRVDLRDTTSAAPYRRGKSQEVKVLVYNKL
ncbi:Fc receptor-like A isoform X2 [Brachyistius frenatus]|uniref:Fc receptor-like A isoform X2 n=1 Tax=Brachyistius frenatus TaxID=100188 RepID=UPI0037E7442A